MRRFSISIEDRILRAPDGEGDGTSDSSTTSSKPKTDTSTTEARAQAEKERASQKAADEARIKAQDDVYERIIKNIEKAKEAYDIDTKRYKLLQEYSKELQTEITTGNSRLNQLGNIATEIEDILAKQEKGLKINEKALASLQDQLTNEKKEIGLLAENLGLRLKTSEMQIDASNATREELDQIQKATEADKSRLEAALRAQQQIDGVTSKVTKNFGLASSAGETLIGKFAGMSNDLKKITGGESGLPMMRKMLKNSVFEALSFKNIAFSIVEETAKMALNVSNLSRNLGAATGYGDQFSNELVRMAKQGNMAGIGFEESAAALKELTTGLSSFNPKAEETNEYVGLTVARLTKLGVGGSSAVKTINTLEKSFGMTSKSAADATAQIARMGKEIGITGSKMIENFNAMSGRIAAFGRTGMRVFKEMSALAKATGMELSTLKQVAEGFDTFDKAAGQAAQLNAVLGTQLSTLELLSATDSERILMIKQQVQMSVGNFDSLDKYRKMYVAQAMGVSDVAEAQKLLNMSTAEYQKYTRGQKEQADIQKEMAEATEELVPLMQQFKLAMTQLFLSFAPLINGFGILIKSIGILIDGFVFMVSLGGLLKSSGDSLGEFFDLVITSLALATAAAYAFGVSFMTALGPIGLVVAGLGALYAIFHKSGSPDLWELPEHSGKAYDSMANSMAGASTAIGATTKSLDGLHDSFHTMGGSKIDMTAIAKIDTNKIASGIKSVKSALMELSTLKIDGFLAMTTDGENSSFVMASDGVIKSLNEGKLSVDVNMPELTLPPINIIIEPKGTNLTDFIDARVEERSTRA